MDGWVGLEIAWFWEFVLGEIVGWEVGCFLLFFRERIFCLNGVS